MPSPVLVLPGPVPSAGDLGFPSLTEKKGTSNYLHLQEERIEEGKKKKGRKKERERKERNKRKEMKEMKEKKEREERRQGHSPG